MDKKLYLTFILLISFLLAKAQYVDYGTDPASIKWNKIKTEHYKIIYPQEYSVWAQHYALILEKSFENEASTMSSKRKISKYPVILHPYNIINNGMVSWAPKRMELRPTSATGESFQLTNRHLAIHEQRHVLQMNLLNQRIGFLKYIFGEQIIGLPSILTPRWFFEGDAVTAETALSSSGRGREADFLMHQRAQYATGKNYSFDKWMLGSYKNYTPSFYSTGYAVTAYARAEYGSQAWNNVIGGLGVLPGTFTRNLKRVTKEKPKSLFNKAFEDMRKEWDYFDNATNFDEHAEYNPDKKAYTNYNSPIQTNEGVISIKWSLSDVNSLVFIDNNKKEKHLTYLGNINSKLVHYGDFVYWTSFNPSVRYENKNYSNIVAYNLNSKSKINLTKKGRFFCPAVSIDGKSIAVYEPDANGENNITIISTSTGKVVKKYSIINNGEVKDLVFSNNGNLIASVITDKGNSLMELNTEVGEWYGVLKSIRTNISKLRNYNEYVLFQSGYNGVNNIYAINSLDLSVQKWTNAKFGATDPFVFNDSLIYTNYTNKGFRLVKTPINTLEKTSIKLDTPHQFSLAEKISAQESFDIDTVGYVGKKPYAESRYRKGANLFNLHSWMPIHIRKSDLHMQISGDADVNPGVTVLSQNNLNTLTSSVAYYYDLKENYNHGELYFKYSGIFPVIQASLDFGGRNYDLKFTKSGDSYFVQAEKADRTAINLEVGTYLPFNFSKNATIQGLQPFFNYTLTSAKVQQYPTIDRMNSFKFADYGIYYYAYKQMAIKDINPRLGIQAWLRGMGDFSQNQNYARLYYARTNIFLPGIVKNHSLKIDIEYQHQEHKYFSFNLPKRFITDLRGFGYLNYFSENAVNLKFDYAFTLANPDFSVGSLMYLKRIRANLFFDYNRGNNVVFTDAEKNAHSYGTEFRFDANWLRMQVSPISIGFRVGHRSDNTFFGDFLFGIKIN